MKQPFKFKNLLCYIEWIRFAFSKVNFASQKRSFTCLAWLDVQDDT